jgi:signal transduction histidine kinase
MDLTEAHGGAIAVDSAPGAGATFVLRVPKRSPTAS